MTISEEIKLAVLEQCKVNIVGIAPGTPFTVEQKSKSKEVLQILANANPIFGNTDIFDPEDFVPGARAVIVFAANSNFGSNPYLETDKLRGSIGNFYLNQNILDKANDNAEMVKQILKEKGYNAEAPFVSFAQKVKTLEAGLGALGKNGLVINKTYGSWISIVTIITDAPLETDTPITEDYCGDCTLCMDACPTGALHRSHPSEMEVEKCITYLNCHLKTEIPVEFRSKIGLRVGNCTICSDVCPYNKTVPINTEDKLSDDVVYPDLTKLVNISEEEHEKQYGSLLFGFIIGGRNILRRNSAIALGNTRNTQALAPLEIVGQDKDLVVASHARWAIEHIEKGPDYRANST